MSDSIELPQVVLALRAAADVREAMVILEDESAARALGAHKKDPAVRKTALLLAALGSSRDANYLKAVLALARMWSVKPLRPIVDEYAARVLNEPLSDYTQLNDRADVLALAAWLSTRKYTWITTYAAEMAVRALDDSEVCLAHVTLLLGRVSVAEGLRLLGDRLSSISAPDSKTLGRGYRHLCIALSSVTATASLKPGKGLARALAALVHQMVAKCGDLEGADRSGLGSSMADLIVTILSRYPATMLTGVPVHLLSELQSRWVDVRQKAWTSQRQQALGQIRAAMTLLAVAGEKPIDLALQARILERDADGVERMCREIEAQYDIAQEDIVRWLQQGGVEGPSPAAESGTDTEAIAVVLLRAEEAAKEFVPHGALEKSLESLLAEIRQLGIRKGMKLEGRVGEIVEYDPVWQRAVAPIAAGTKVRIVTPGVSRAVRHERFQVIQAIVSPV